jgi:hypothetical protein
MDKGGLLQELEAASGAAEMRGMDEGAVEDGPVAAEEDEAGEEEGGSVSDGERAHLSLSLSLSDRGRLRKTMGAMAMAMAMARARARAMAKSVSPKLWCRRRFPEPRHRACHRT